jgi:hypothetical protein
MCRYDTEPAISASSVTQPIVVRRIHLSDPPFIAPPRGSAHR